MVLPLLLMVSDRVLVCICDWLTFSGNDFRKPGSEGTYQAEAAAAEVSLEVRTGREYTDKGGGDGFTRESAGELAWWSERKWPPEGVALLGGAASLE